MDFLTNLINGNMVIVVTVVAFLLTHFSASITVALTKTKNNKFYKFLELLALVIKKAKEKNDK